MSDKLPRWIRAGIELCASCWRPANAGTLLPRAKKRKRRRYWMVGKFLRIGANLCRGHGRSLRVEGDRKSKDITGEEGGKNKKITTKDQDPNFPDKTMSDCGRKREEKVRRRKHKHKRRKIHSRNKMRDRLLCKLQAKKNAIDLSSRYLDFQTTRNSDELGISELKKGLFSTKFSKANGQDQRRLSLIVTQVDKEVYEKVQKRFGHCKSAWTECEDPRRDVASVEEIYEAVHATEGPANALEGSNHGRNVDDHKQVLDINQDIEKEHDGLSSPGEVCGQNERSGGQDMVIRGRFESGKHEEGIMDLVDVNEVCNSSSEESVISAAEGGSQGVFSDPNYPPIINRLTARCVGLDIYDDDGYYFCHNDGDDGYVGDVDDEDDDDEDDDDDHITTDSYDASCKMSIPDPYKTSDGFSHNNGYRNRSSTQDPEQVEESDLTNRPFVISVSIRVDGHTGSDSNKSKDEMQEIGEEGTSDNTPRPNKQEAGDWEDIPGHAHWQSQLQTSACPEVRDPSAVGEQAIMKLPKAPLVGEQRKDLPCTMHKPPLHPTRLKKKKVAGEIQGPENTVED